MLSQKQLKDVCLVNDGSHKKCRYLSHDENDYTKYYCLKKNARKQEIDFEIEEFIKKALNLGKDPKSENVPLGDNCQGYPVLRLIEQGYDQKP